MEFPAGPRDAASEALDPLDPHVIVLFGATGDLAKRKLLPGILHLAQSGLLPDFRIVATSLEQLETDEFRGQVREACEEFSRHPATDGGVRPLLQQVRLRLNRGRSGEAR